jgi:putative FmdB family regulatory protein
MPIYEYTCAACASRVEITHGINDAPPARCTTCGGALERVFTAPRLNLVNSPSPTAARYAKMSPAEEGNRMRADLDSLRRERPSGSDPA